MMESKTLYESFMEDVTSYKEGCKYAPTKTQIVKNVIRACHKEELTVDECNSIIKAVKDVKCMSKVTEALTDYEDFEVYRIMFNWELEEYSKLFEGMYTPFKGTMFPTGEYYVIRNKNTKEVYGGIEIITDAVVADRLYFGPVCMYLLTDYVASGELRKEGAIYVAEAATTLAGKGKGAVSSVIEHLIKKEVPMFIYPTHGKMVEQCKTSGLTAIEDASNLLLDNYPHIYTNVPKAFEREFYDMYNVEYATGISVEDRIKAIKWHRGHVNKGMTQMQQNNFEALVMGIYDLSNIIDYTNHK